MEYRMREMCYSMRINGIQDEGKCYSMRINGIQDEGNVL